MNTPDANADEPSPDHEFNKALTDLIQSTLADGVDVRGGWRVDLEGPEYDFGVEIYRVDGSDD